MAVDINELSEFEKGRFAKVKTRFDSKSEKAVCVVLNRILEDYDLTKHMQIRLTPQQPLDNYVEVTNEKYKDYYTNKFKWMKFDFIFEQVYESNNGKYPQMNYFPILVVEFDGPHHDTEEQKKLDLYKNGITDKIGAGMVRMRYDEVENLSETELRKVYEDEIIEELVKGYFKKRRYQIGKENLIRDDSKKYQRLIGIYSRLSNLGIDYQQLDSNASIKKWNAGQLQVGLIHPASAGHGLNLQSGGNILVWFGITWSLELYQQTVARLWRQGQTEGTVSVIHIVTDGTVDERILKALEAKDLTQSALIDAVKAEVGDGK